MTAGVLALAAFAPTAQAADIRSGPTITGPLQVGQQLTAAASWTPQLATPTYTWVRCDSPSDRWWCSMVQSSSASTYLLTERDAGKFMRVWLSVGSGRDRDTAMSDATAAVAAAPVPTATPAATPSATPVPTATPTPVATVPPAPTPVPTQGAVLRSQGENLRVLRPAPKVRIRGTLSSRGANITLLSVRAPKRATITVTCKGSSCPRKRYTTKQAKVRVRAFERDLRVKTRLEVRVRRAGYFGKSTLFIIRRGKAPYRLDRCLSARGRYTACPK